MGILCALSVYIFLLLLEFFNEIFFTQGANVFFFLKKYYVIILPALGGLIVGPLVYYLAKEARGHGVPEVMSDLTLKNGVIPFKVVLVKTLAASVTIGSGGSAGRVGPIIHISAGLGSWVGQVLKVPARLMRSLVVCGAAGGVAATFNAPIGGMLFAMEVILGEFSTVHLLMVVTASVTASIMSSVLFNNAPVFVVPIFTLSNPLELLLYALVGVASGFLSYIYIKVFYKTEDVFNSIKNIPAYIKPVIGGLLVGLVGFMLPQIYGVGYDVIEDVLAGKMTLSLLVALLVVKLLATSVTLGSGGSGGVFAPTLYLGATLGGVLGLIFHQLIPELVQQPMAYALAGMAGMLSASSFAPITAIILIFEISNEYTMILPFMITSIISYVIVNSLTQYNIYTTKLYKKGVDINLLRNQSVFRDINVQDVMTVKPKTIDAEHKIAMVWEQIKEYPYSSFPVLGEKGNILGLVSRVDLHKAMVNGHADSKVAQLLAERQLCYVIANDSLGKVLSLMYRHQMGRLPVLDNNMNLVGIISHSDIINAYGAASGIITYSKTMCREKNN